jgi:hypothetical protein
MFSAAAVKRDTEIMMTRAVIAGIPLIIGSAGTSGSDAGLACVGKIPLVAGNDVIGLGGLCSVQKFRVGRIGRDGRWNIRPEELALAAEHAARRLATHMLGEFFAQPIRGDKPALRLVVDNAPRWCGARRRCDSNLSQIIWPAVDAAGAISVSLPAPRGHLVPGTGVLLHLRMHGCRLRSIRIKL